MCVCVCVCVRVVWTVVCVCVWVCVACVHVLVCVSGFWFGWGGQAARRAFRAASAGMSSAGWSAADSPSICWRAGTDARDIWKAGTGWVRDGRRARARSVFGWGGKARLPSRVGRHVLGGLAVDLLTSGRGHASSMPQWRARAGLGLGSGGHARAGSRAGAGSSAGVWWRAGKAGGHEGEAHCVARATH